MDLPADRNASRLPEHRYEALWREAHHGARADWGLIGDEARRRWRDDVDRAMATPPARPMVLPSDWEVARVMFDSGLTMVGRMTMREFVGWGADPSLFHVAAFQGRPGFITFAQHLEYTYYPPRTPRNAAYQLHWLRWSEMEWAVVTIPRKGERLAHRSAERVGMRLADGVPTILDGRTVSHFPLRGGNVWTLEAGTRPGGPITSEALERESDVFEERAAAFRRSPQGN